MLIIKAINRYYAMVLILEEQKQVVVLCSTYKQMWGRKKMAATWDCCCCCSCQTFDAKRRHHRMYSHQPCNSQFSSKLESRLVGVWTELWRLLLSWFFSLSEPTNLSRLFYRLITAHSCFIKIVTVHWNTKVFKILCVCIPFLCSN